MAFNWPADFRRVPDDDWVTSPLEQLALKYDSVENHGWYDNLDLTLDQLFARLQAGQCVIDYSGGTGILVDRLLRRCSDLDAGFVIIDASPKFLRRALHKLGGDPRVAFRRIRYLRQAKRLEYIEEVLPPSLSGGGVDVLVSTNAIHLYYGLDETLRSWTRALRPGGSCLIQSGNILNPARAEGEWIIDDTVERLQPLAREIVARDPRYAEHRSVLLDSERMQRYDALRAKYFLAPRPLDFYLDALVQSGFVVESCEARAIEANVQDWFEFLGAYHDGVLGWLGGTEKIDGHPPRPEVVQLRLEVIRQALSRLIDGRTTFQASWTYITCRRLR